MIQSFRNKGLAKFWNEGNPKKGDPKAVPGDLRDRVRRKLTVLDGAQVLSELPPAYRCQPVGVKPKRYGIDVNGPWRITFEWKDGNALRVDLEQYH